MSLISVDCIAQIPLLLLPFRTSATQATFVLLQIDRSNNPAIVLHHVPTNLALVVQTLDYITQLVSLILIREILIVINIRWN